MSVGWALAQQRRSWIGQTLVRFHFVLTGCYAQIVLFIIIPAKAGIHVWIGIELA